MIIWGQVNSANVQSFKKNLTRPAWNKCQLCDVHNKNSDVRQYANDHTAAARAQNYVITRPFQRALQLHKQMKMLLEESERGFATGSDQQESKGGGDVDHSLTLTGPHYKTIFVVIIHLV